MRKPPDPPLYIDAEKFKQRVIRSRLTLSDIAIKLRLPYATVYNWANGLDIDPVHLYRLSKLFHCTMASFLHDDFEKEGV